MTFQYKPNEMTNNYQHKEKQYYKLNVLLLYYHRYDFNISSFKNILMKYLVK